MTGQLAKIYSETLQAQVGMQILADELGRTLPAPAVWNDVEEALETALERFRAYRQQCRAEMPSNRPSPGFAGAYNASQGGLATTEPFAPSINPQPL
jgi:hypothetical protein